MHIELIGCTSAGKTTLAQKMITLGKHEGVDVVLGDDFVLQKLHLSWVKSEFLRRRLMEICAGYICLMRWQKYREFCNLVFAVIKQRPETWFYKINIVRIVLRKIGIYELIQKGNSETRIVLVDNEGIVQAVHTLFVHTSSQLNGNLSSFVQSAPLPDMIAYLRQPEQILLERTLQRGHPRVRNPSPHIIQEFIKKATVTFEKLQTLPTIDERSFVINGESQTVIKPNSRNGMMVEQVHNLLQKSIRGGYTKESSGEDFESDSYCLDLIDRIIKEFDVFGINYCHWKSNINLKKSMRGDADLDFFIEDQFVPPALSILSEHGFKAARIRYGLEPQGVNHYYGLDEATGRLVHVHLFKILLTGESFVKSHRFPFEKFLLKNCDKKNELSVLSKPAELVFFILRTFVKYGSLPDILNLYGKSLELRKELRWLLDNRDIVNALALLYQYCPAISESLFLQCVEAINENNSVFKKMYLARQVRRQLRGFAKYNYRGRVRAYTRVLLAKSKCILKGNLRNKVLHSGGAIIAFVGGDATGKSTLVAETKRWLGGVFAVQNVHVGKPPTSLLSVLFNITLPLARLLLPKHRRSQIQIQQQRKKTYQGNGKGSFSLPYALRAVFLAWDRYRLLRKVESAKAQDVLVICDRYPSEITGAMDSPRLTEEMQNKGLASAFYNWLTRMERELYRRIPPPDIVIKLSVSLETAKKRNQERRKGDRDTDEFIEARHKSVREWHMIGTKHAFEISTDLPLPETILKTKKVIWEVL